MTAVLITGASGLIGGHLAKRLNDAGATLLGVGCQSIPAGDFTVSCVRRFGEPFGHILRERHVDVVVHCAHDVSAGGAEASERGTLQWAREAEQVGVLRQIYVSSISARKDALASYGRVKYRLEQWFLEHGSSVFRLGLVIGMGGLFARIVNSVQNLPLVPLIDGGRSRVFFCGVDFVADQLAREALDWQGNLQLNLQQPEPTTMRELLDTVRHVLNARSRFIPVPYLPCLAAAWMLDRCGIRVCGITYENIAGLRQNDVFGLRSDFLNLQGQPENLQTLVERAIRGDCGHGNPNAKGPSDPGL